MTPGARNLLNPREVYREVKFMMRRVSIEVAPVTYDLLLTLAESRGIPPLNVLNEALLAYAFPRERPPIDASRTLPLPIRPQPAPRAPRPEPVPGVPTLTPAQWRALDAIAGGDPTGGTVSWKGTVRPVNFRSLVILAECGLIEPVPGSGPRKWTPHLAAKYQLTEAGRLARDSRAAAAAPPEETTAVVD